MAVESLDMKNTKGLLNEKEEDNSLIEFQETLREAISILNFPPQVFEFLKKPMHREIELCKNE